MLTRHAKQRQVHGMKILICSTSSALGGIERRIVDETRLLTAKGHVVVVATPHFDHSDGWQNDIRAAGGRYIEWAPYKFIEREHFAAPFRWLALASLSLLLRERFDFAHLALPYNYIGMSMASLLTQAKIPFVVAMHCKCGSRALSERGQVLVVKAMRCMVGGYAVSQPVNESFRRLYTGLLPHAAMLETIANGIDVERFKPNMAARSALRQKLGLEDQQFTVILCGRIHAMKRPTFAVNVFAKLLAKCPDARLLVVGDGPDAPALKAEIDALGIQQSVCLLGHVPDTSPYYAASDCYLSTSLNEEGCPLATAEALACGLPAVVPNDDVYHAVYGACPAVHLCDHSSQSGWDDALLSIAKCGELERARASKDAKDFVDANLTQAIMMQKLSTFYDGVFKKLTVKP